MVAAPTSIAARARIEVTTAPVLAALVALSLGVRLVVGWLRATPNYFSDEYIYAELGRSLLETGRPLARGTELAFPALLQPLLTAPAWIADDVWISYRVIQALGALAMSLAAVPAFVLARRVGANRPLAFGAAAFSLAIPDLLFSSWVTAEPFAYPLFLAAMASGVGALDQPTRRRGLMFLAFAVLAAFARVQFVVLPLCFVAAVGIVGLRERNLRRALREHALVLGVLAGSLALVAGIGFRRFLGFYDSALDGRANPLELAERIGLNSLVLAYSSGWILLPGALLAFGLAIARPRSRAELGFAALALPVILALLLEASLAGAVEHAQERYVFYALPLACVAFCLYAARGWPARVHHALIAAALVAASATVPLAGYAAAEGKAHSPLLLAAFQVELWTGSPGNGSLLLAAAAAVALGAGVAVSRSPRFRTPVALGLAIAAASAAWGTAVTFDNRNSSAVRAAFLPGDPSWIDRHGVDGAVLVRGPQGVKTEALEQLFWNRSVDRVALLPGADQLDHVTSPRLRVDRDGTLLLEGHPIRTPVVMDGYAGTLRLGDAELLESSASFSLWRPRATARLSLYFAGHYSDGWLAGAGRLYLWPERRGGLVAKRVVLTLTAPEVSPITLRFQSPNMPRPAVVRLRAGERKAVTFDACSRGPWSLSYLSDDRGFMGGRIVSAHAGEPKVLSGSCKFTPRAGGRSA